jgi:phage tail-like protein
MADSFVKGGARYATNDGDWLVGNRFQVSIEGFPVGEFQEVELPEISVEEVAYHTGSTKHALKRPGEHKIGDLVLTRGYNQDRTFREWLDRVKAGDAERRSMTINMIDEHDNVTAAFNFYNCWPKKWKLGKLDGKSNEIQVENITFAVEDFEQTA